AARLLGTARRHGRWLLARDEEEARTLAGTGPRTGRPLARRANERPRSADGGASAGALSYAGVSRHDGRRLDPHARYGGPPLRPAFHSARWEGRRGGHPARYPHGGCCRRRRPAGGRLLGAREVTRSLHQLRALFGLLLRAWFRMAVPGTGVVETRGR